MTTASPINTLIHVENFLPSTPHQPTKELEQRALEIPERILDIRIIDQMSYNEAAELLKATKALRDEAESHHRLIIKSAHTTHKLACDALNRIDKPLETAEAVIKRKLSDWDDIQQMIARRIARQAQEAAAKRQAEEVEAELLMLEAQAAERPQDAPAIAAEVKQIIQEAAAAPVIAPAPVRTYMPAAGLTPTKKFVATVTNMPALLAYCAANPLYASLLQVNQPALNALLKAHGERLSIPGITVTSSSSVTARK